jgi:Ca2+-binding RTX toxin-like protein
MDHGWDGFYTSQKRLQRFPVMLETGIDHTVRFTGTPPQQLRFKLEAGSTQAGVKVKIPYPNAGIYSVRANGKKITPQPFDEQLGHPTQLPKATCGENRFQNLANWLEFYITPGCQIDVKPLDAIAGAVRMQWTMAEFWGEENDGNSKTGFAYRLASALGVHPSRIYTVQVYEGSVVVRFGVAADDRDLVDADGNPVLDGQGNPLVLEDFDPSTIASGLVGAAEAGDNGTARGAFGGEVMGLEEEGETVTGTDVPPPPEEDWTAEFFGSAEHDQVYNTVVEGTTGNDVIHRLNDQGSPFGWSILGHEGNDILDSGHGSDDILGGSGDDIIRGHKGDDRISGGHGDDVIFGGAEDDKIHGGTGADELHGGVDVDIVSGGHGDDTITGGTHGDYLYGGYGEDTISGDEGDDHIEGNEGMDTIFGGH